MRRRLSTMLSVLSLLLFLATGAIWVRSCFYDDWFCYTASPNKPVAPWLAGCESFSGRFHITRDISFAAFTGQPALHGWDYRCKRITSHDDWPLWGTSDNGPPSRFG